MKWGKSSISFPVPAAAFAAALIAALMFGAGLGRAAEEIGKAAGGVVTLDEVKVTERRTATLPETPPEKTVIDFENFERAAPVHSVVDVLKDSALIDFRGRSDLDLRSERGESPILLRGFDVRRYINAVDGVTFDQPLSFGQVVDYDLVPMDRIESVEIIPGAHSAIYSGKSLGGVINFKTKTPEVKESARPEGTVSSGYGSYGTWDTRASIEGGAGGFNYAASVQDSSTDGYLRHGASEKDVYGWMLGYAFASGGYLKYMGNMVEKEQESFAKNDPAGDYDDDYPVVTSDTAGDIAADSRTHFETWVHRFSYVQPTALGKFFLGLSYTEKADHYSTEISNGVRITNPNSQGKNLALVLKDEIELFDVHTFVFGADTLDYWITFAPREDDDNRTRSHKSGFIEDTWQITPRLKVRAGLRYENSELSINNYSTITGWGSIKGYQVTLDPPQRYIEKNFDDWMPKFFATYQLDDHADFLRDTSVSVGASKFWNVAPYCLVCPGRYAQVDPEHGMNYDLIFDRRLWRDIQCKVDFSYYDIQDYVADNWDFGKYSLYQMKNGKKVFTGVGLPAGLEGSDMYINLDRVIRRGVEVELNGHLIDALSFYVSYAFQDLDYEGSEPAGKELGDVAKHRVNAGLRYRPFERTALLLDYKYQDEQIAHAVVESPAGSGNYVSYDTRMAASNVFDLGLRQTLYSDANIKDLTLGFYISNLFNEKYENSHGFPMTDQSYTAELSLHF